MTLVADPQLAGATALTTPMCCRTGQGDEPCTLKAARSRSPSTLGRPILRSFRWGHVRGQLDRVSRELLAPLAWAAGAGPGDAPFRPIDRT